MEKEDFWDTTGSLHQLVKLKDMNLACIAPPNLGKEFGLNELCTNFNDMDKIYQFGPYGPQHATAGTFAFKRELLKEHSYENHAALAEEKHFLILYFHTFM